MVRLILQVRILKYISQLRIIQNRLLDLLFPLNPYIAYSRGFGWLLFMSPRCNQILIKHGFRLLCIIGITFLLDDLIEINNLLQVIVMLYLIDCVV